MRLPAGDHRGAGPAWGGVRAGAAGFLRDTGASVPPCWPPVGILVTKCVGLERWFASVPERFRGGSLFRLLQGACGQITPLLWVANVRGPASSRDRTDGAGTLVLRGLLLLLLLNFFGNSSFNSY